MDSLQPGDPVSVGGYRLLGRLGAGGMGQVFFGESPGGRMVAVKLIHPAHAGTPHFRERFAREIEAARRVGGFHTAPVVDADPHADPPWMVTAYIEGPSLQDAVGRWGPMPPDRLRALGAGLAEGLAAIHASGLVHRDLKPANVILPADGPRIIDFGIARAVDATTGLTTTGSVVGTIAYMSPEQIRGEPADPASDVFSLGCVLAFAATGRPPFSGDSAAAVMFRIVNQPPDLTGVAEAGLAGLIMRCLAKTAAERPGVPAVLAAFTGRGVALAAVPATAAPAPAGAGDGPPTQTHAPAARAHITSGTKAPHARRARRRSGKGIASWFIAAVTAVAAAVTAALVYGVPALTGRTAPRATDLSVTGPVPVRDRTLSSQVGAQFGGISFSPDGHLLAAGSGGQAYLWNLVTGQRLVTLDDPGDGAGAEAFSPDGKLLADGDSVLNRIYMWDTATGRRAATLAAPGSGGIDSAAFSADGKLLAAGDSNKHVYVWDTANGRLTLTLADASIDGGVAFSPDGKLLAAAGVTGSGGLTYLWNAATGQKVATLRDPGGQSVNAVAFSPDGKVLATGDSDGSVYEFSTATDRALTGLAPPGQHGPVNAVTFSPDGTLLAAADGNSHAYVWNAATDKVVGSYAGTGSWPVWGVAFSPNGKLLAIADGDGNLYVRVTSQLLSPKPRLLPTPGPNTGTAPDSSPSPTQAITFACKILQLNTQTGLSEQFDVTTAGGSSYLGTITVNFYGPPGSGQVFPDTTVNGATSTAAWHQVPAADIGASAEPYSCSASAG
jgi:WD40 repeat protein